MKKILGLVVVVVAIASLLASCGEPRQARQFMFLNSSDKELRLVVERNGQYEVERKVPAHSNAPEYIEIGEVDLMVFDGEKCIVLFEKYQVTKDSSTKYTCLDMTGKVQYAVVSTAYLYEASNSLSQSVADASGGGKELEFLGPLRGGENAFELDFAPIWPYEKLLKKTGAMETGWALVPVYTDITDKAALSVYADEYLRSLGTE
ncbi:MAG: hypothetical protein BGO31_03195 [Bacteroidetes bacterium 43-16]|nr:MAG: hypothetical protein BGO31_03195 [Bacteroidetes bacterium 43-16]